MRKFAASVCVRPAARTHPVAVEAVLVALGRGEPHWPVVLDLRHALMSDLMLEVVRRSLTGPDALAQSVSVVVDRPFARRKLRPVLAGLHVPLYVSVQAALQGGREGRSARGCARRGPAAL